MSTPSPAAGGRKARVAADLLVRLRWWVIAFWVAATASALLLLPSLSESQGGNDLRGLLPADTPAVKTELRSVELFGFPLLGRTVVVQRNPGGLSPYEQARTVVNAAGVMRQQRPGLRHLRGALPITNSLDAFPGTREDGTTALTYLLFDRAASFSAQSRTARHYARTSFGPLDHYVGVTGSVPARAEQAHIIRDRLPAVEALTLGAILLIVGVAFRSVVAPLVSVLVTLTAYVVTLRLSGELARVLGFATPSELEPVVVALLLGVVTDYVVFYLSALRQELEVTGDRLIAARAATARCGPIVAVAGLAVAAGTAALMVAESLFFRSLGPALVFTVLMGLVVAVSLVPAVLAVLGGWSLWPTRPQAGLHPRLHGRRWRRLLGVIAHRRRVAGALAGGCVAVLLMLAIPLSNLNLGVSFVGSLPTDNRVRAAAASAREGFAPGILSPTTVLLQGADLGAHPARLERLQHQLADQPGVAGVLGPGTLPPALERDVLITDDGQAARFLVVLQDAALGAAAIDTVDRLERRMPGMLAASGLGDVDVGVAGDTATAAYIVDQTSGDLVRIALAALAANLLMLVLFLRAIVAAIYLLVGSVLALAASIGLTMLVFDAANPGAGLTFYVPFAAAVLLLAFGSDYNIFAVGNVWEEARRRPLPEAIITAMPTTISAIIVAGLALATSFGLLAVVPLLPFRQLAFTMAVGIALDVLVVRSLLLPALLTVVGRWSAWPSQLRAASSGEPISGPAEEVRDASR